jgi:hypothetical protein
MPVHSITHRILATPTSCFALLALLLPCALSAQDHTFTVLHPQDYSHYDQQFAADEREATGTTPSDEWPWMQANIPLFNSSDKRFEEMYYFRWYAWQKHVVETKRGFVITEWLPKPEMTDGFFGALPDAAPFHLNEARWLRNPKIAEDDARFWLSPDGDPRKYSTPIAASVRDVTLANGDTALATSLLPAMVANYKAWQASSFDASSLGFWSIDTRDAMEKSISGDGYRPTLNSYMYADARAISDIAWKAGDSTTSGSFAAEAKLRSDFVETQLWNSRDKFYEVMSPDRNSGIRLQKRFVDPGTTHQLSGTRELIGYIPWQYMNPPAAHDVAWKQLFDSQGFAGKFGPTTAERRSPRFRFVSSDQCTWNGPSWPFGTTQTLLALANLLNGPSQPYMATADYYALFSNYILSQHLKLPSGRTIEWIDEDLDADTDEWIAKDMLKAKNKQVGRGNYYNHSGFADPLITGLVGLRPSPDNLVRIHPLLPGAQWTYFALDGLPYHGHILAIVFDSTGGHYNKGRGLTLFIDGQRAASRPTLGPLQAQLPVASAGVHE